MTTGHSGSLPDHVFAEARREESWSFRPEERSLVSRRLIHGQARQRGREIEARDTADPLLLRACDERMEALHGALAGVDDCEVRLMAAARRVDGHVNVSETIGLTRQSISIVTTALDLAADYELLARLTPSAVEPAVLEERDLPIVWQRGSAAVLLHEAAGHAAEQRCEPVHWPAWLAVFDEPDAELDDTGAPSGSADLLAGECPRCRRRESFTDVPLPRMSNVLVRQLDAPFALPERRIEVHLTSGGRFEPLNETITIAVAVADLVEGNAVRRLPPFEILTSRRAVAAGLAGAVGEPLRYPGVICSSEGQELYVGSFAPVMVTTF